MRSAQSSALLSTLLSVSFLGATPVLAQTQTPAQKPKQVQSPTHPQKDWWSQPGGNNGPTRIVWAANKNPETPYNAPNKPIWHIADVLKAHQGQARWEQPVLLTRDFAASYVKMAPGDKTKCQFWADDRAWGWVYSGQVKVTIDGQVPKVLSKGWAYNVAPRLSYCFEAVGKEPVIMFRITPAGQVPSYPENVTPTPVPGYTYVKARINATGGYDSFNVPYYNIDAYGASGRTGGRFLYDGHTSSNLNIGPAITALPPSTSWGHFHENMPEVWLDVYGQVCPLISGIGVVHAQYGDLINANEERWHRATSCPNTGRSIRMAITPRSKEGQLHYYQVDQPPGN